MNALRPLKAVVLISSLFYSCSKTSDDGPPPTPNQQLTLSASSAAPYQLVAITLPSMPKRLLVDVGSETTDIWPNRDSLAKNVQYYYMLVPEVGAGAQSVNIELMNNDWAGATLTITSFNKIPDVNKYITDLQAAEQKEINDATAVYNAGVQAGEIRASWADSAKNFMQQALNTSKTLVSQLNADEKRIYVQLLESDKAFLAEYKQVYAENEINNARVTAQNCEELRAKEQEYTNAGLRILAEDKRIEAEICEANKEQARLKANANLNKKMREYHAAAKEAAGQQKGWWKTAKAYVSTFASEAAKGVFETITGFKDLKDAFAPILIEDTKNQRVTAGNFESEKEYEFAAGIELVNLNRQSAAQFPAFGEMIAAVDLYNTLMPNMSDYFPWIPTMNVPAAKSEKVYVGDYTIDQVSDTRIVPNLKQGYLLKFSLNPAAVEENIDFSFRVNYTSQYGSVSKVIASNLVQPVEKILVNAGPFKVIKRIEGGVDEFSMHEIHRWTCENNTYINKEQLLNATLNFLAGGTGTSYELYHEVYYESKGGVGCNVNFVDREMGYNGSMTWSYDKSTKSLNAIFKDDEGVEKNVTASVSIQNGIITFSTTGLLLQLQKK